MFAASWIQGSPRRDVNVDQGGNKVDIVERQILETIEGGELTTGTVLEQRESADQLEVSPTPVREAFRRLEIVGMSSTPGTGRRPGRRPHRHRRRGHKPGALDARETSASTCILAARDPGDLADLPGTQRAVPDRAPAMRPSEAHWQFHLGIFEIAGSIVLTNHVRVLWSLVDNATRHAATARSRRLSMLPSSTP